MADILIEPRAVLAQLGRSAKVRSNRTKEEGVVLWSKVIWGPDKGTNADSILATVRLVKDLCTEIEKGSSSVSNDLSKHWMEELSSRENGASFTKHVETLSHTTPDMEAKISVTESEIYSTIRQTEAIIEEIARVSDKKQTSIYTEIANYLATELIPIMKRSIELGVWLLRPELLSNIGAHLLTFGMRLSASGDMALAERIGLIALSTASLVAGVVDPALGLSLGAMSVLFTAATPAEMVQKLLTSPKTSGG